MYVLKVNYLCKSKLFLSCLCAVPEGERPVLTHLQGELGQASPGGHPMQQELGLLEPSCPHWWLELAQDL